MSEIEGLRAAASAIGRSRALLITAGAGMAVDSGLPDFRGDRGFWNAYPPYESRGLRFTDLANPHWFRRDLNFAWGFYGHRLSLYRSTAPHEGFDCLLRWAGQRELGWFVVTSNVDGQFQKAGFAEDRIIEIHGSIHHLQCTADCGVGIVDGAETSVAVEEQSMRARDPVPACPHCGRPLRPNILMFGDRDWDSTRTDRQSARYHRWLRYLRTEAVSAGDLAIIECGAGTALPAIRSESERRSDEFDAPLIRINRFDPEVPDAERDVALHGSALELLRGIDSAIAATS